MSRRIVFLHRQGDLAGVAEICGTDDEFRRQLNTQDFPAKVAWGDRHAQLAAVESRYILYRELLAQEQS